MTNKPMRRAKGAGSIRQRGRGSWQIRYDGPPDANGKITKLSEAVRGSRRDAEKALRDRLGVVEDGSYVAKNKETVAEFMQRWLDTYAATNTTVRTQQGYRYYAKRHISPTLGAIALQNLKAPQIQGLYASMLEKGLSARTVLHCHRIFKGALNHAVLWGELARNPADSVTPPRPIKGELETWDADTFQAFLEAAKDSPFRDMYHLAVLTGMRRSELCGLKWGDVNLDNAELRIVRTLQRIDGQGLVEGQPKTQRSRRTLALGNSAVDLLHRVRAEQAEQRLAIGELWQARGFVFTKDDGTPISGERVSKDFAKIVRSNELPHLTLHGLRHTAASLLIAGGVHPRTIADILGHSSISITMDVYGHLINGVQREAVSILDEQPASRG